MTEVTGYIQQVGDFIHGFELDQCPKEVTGAAQRVLLDTLGAIIAGVAAPEVAALQCSLGIRTDLRANLVSSPGSSLAFAPPLAAFIHGTAGTWFELDEGNYVTNQHPAIHVVPAAMAVAESRAMSGKDLLSAVVVGYEVSGRAGMATTFRDDVMHPHGTHGVLGGGAAVAKLHGMSARAAGETIRIASSMSVATARGTVFEGATVRNSYAGQAGQSSVLSGDLVRAGFRGQASGPTAVFGQVSGTEFDEAQFVEGLGVDFLICRNYFKFYSCCAYNHATLNALQAAIAQRTFHTSDVDRVDVMTYFPAVRMNSAHVTNSLAAKFSLPYSVSAMMLQGHCWQEAFEDPTLGEREMRTLMRKVRVIEDKAATDAFPHRQIASVRILLKDGSELQSSVESVRGDWRSPVVESELMDKFLRLVAPVLGEECARDLGQGVMDDEPIDARAIGKLIRGPRQ